MEHGLACGPRMKKDTTEPVPCIYQGLVQTERPAIFSGCLCKLTFLLERIRVPCCQDRVIRVPDDRFAEICERFATDRV